MLQGGDPYSATPNVAPFFINEQLIYPGTALIASAPVAPLPYSVALAVFFGVGAGLLGYGIARTEPFRFAVFCSFPFAAALLLGHWSPYLAASLILPAAGFVVAVKPNLGLAVLFARPSRPMVIGAIALTGISLVVMPSWPFRWLSNLTMAPPHLLPVATWLGAPLVLALLRWRRPEARLLLAMALLPQTATFADQLLLFFVAQSRRESVLLAAMSIVGGLAWMSRLQDGIGHPAIIGAPYVVASLYLPALFLVLRRPNAGSVSPWIERRLNALPVWLRGTPEPPLDVSRSFRSSE